MENWREVKELLAGGLKLFSFINCPIMCLYFILFFIFLELQVIFNI